MAKINKRAFSKIRQEIDKLAISKRSRAMFDDVEGIHSRNRKYNKYDSFSKR